MFIWNHRRFMSLLTWSPFKIINLILFYFNLFFCLVLGTTIIHENNEESRYVYEIIRNCQKTHVYIIWFINKQTRGFMIICKGLNTLHLYSWIKRYIEIKKNFKRAEIGRSPAAQSLLYDILRHKKLFE